MRHWFGLGIEDNVDMLTGELPLPDLRFYCHPEPIDLPGWIYTRLDMQERMQDGEAFQGLGDTLDYLAWGNSVAMIAVQLACYIGFTTVILLGCDATLHGHVYNPAGEDEPQRLRQDSFMRSAQCAEAKMARAGRRLLDASGPGGQLPIGKADLCKLLS